jgi:quercetin 2,3-dioxygenase
MGKIDVLSAGDYSLASFGSGGKHCELNLEADDMNAIYVWVLPNRLMLPPVIPAAILTPRPDATRS